jgi:hypothetical protein
MKFVSEAQLEENKAIYGERREDGTFEGRTLSEAIAAQREEREARFKDAWKQMKTGAQKRMLKCMRHYIRYEHRYWQ